MQTLTSTKPEKLTDQELDDILIAALSSAPGKLAALRTELPRWPRTRKLELAERLRVLGETSRSPLPKLAPRSHPPAPVPDPSSISDHEVAAQLEQMFESGRASRLSARKQELLNCTSAQKRELLHRLLEASLKGTRQARLSFAQQRSWFMESLAPGAQNIAAAVKAEGPLDLGLMTRAFNVILRRHETLRTYFVSVRGQPVQRIAPSGEISIQERDFNHFPEQERNQAALEAALSEAYRPFNLSVGPPWRIHSFKMSENSRILLLVMHHIIGDEWSIGVLLRELGQLYVQGGNPAGLPELAIQYADFAEWQAEALTPAVLQYQTDYWVKKLSGAPFVLEVPTDRPRPPVQTTNGAMERQLLPTRVCERMTAIARQNQATFFMAMFSVFNVLLASLTGREDILVGTDFANRNRPGVGELIGFFVNELVLRTDLSGDPTFVELLQRVRRTTLESYNHQDLPFQWLVEQLKPKRDRSRPPIFQVVFDLHNVPLVLEFKSISFSPIRLSRRPAKYDLTLFISNIGPEMTALLEYNTDLYDRSTAQRLLRQYEQLLAAVAAAPETPISKFIRIVSSLHSEAWPQAASTLGQHE